MVPNCFIRKATHHDLDALLALLQILFSIEADFTFNETNQRRGLELMLDDPTKHCIMVAELNGEVIGMCTAQLLITTAEGGMAALVEDMVVHREYRQQGIGKSLLAEIQVWALAKGVKRLELLADRNNSPALEFYQKLNWQQTQLVCLHKKPQ